MGRPVKSTNADKTNRFSANDTGNQFMVLAKIAGQSVAECFVIAQRGANKFYVQDGSGNKGIVTLVNKVEHTTLDTNVPAGLADGEAIMNCKKHGGTSPGNIRRVMKLMNRTVIFSDDNTPTNDNYKAGTSLTRAKWSFAAGDLAADPDSTDPYVMGTVQLEEMAGGGGDFVTDP